MTFLLASLGMAFFARRGLQRQLLGLQRILPLETRRHLARALNSKKPQENAAAQWELAVLAALTQLGVASVPPSQPGKRKIDLVVSRSSGESVGFEVTALSNTEQVKQYGVDAFTEWLFERLRQQDISGSWNFEFQFTVEEAGKTTRVVPSIPRGHPALEEFRTAHLQPILAEVRGNLSESRSFTIQGRGYSFDLTYTPSSALTFGLNAGSSDEESSLTENPIWRRLKDKSSQFRESGFDGPAIVVICDAGLPLFRWDEKWHQVTAKRICSAYLATDPQLSAILLLQTYASGRSRSGKRPVADLILASGAGAPHPLPPSLRQALGNLGDRLPPLQTDGLNYLQHFSSQRGQRSFRFFDNLWKFKKQGSEMSFSTRFSARGTIEALAKNPCDADGIPLARGFNTLIDMVKLGRRLKSVSLVRDDDSDDDWIEFDFEERPDAAVSPIEGGD